MPIIFIKSYYDPKYIEKNIYENYKSNGLDKLCHSKTFGSKFYRIKPKYNEKIFIKHVYDAFTNQKLKNYLKKKDIKTIIFTGVQTDVCVDSTERSAFMKGYKIIAIKDCLASTNLENHKLTLKFMEKYYNAQIRSSKNPIKRLKCVV